MQHTYHCSGKMRPILCIVYALTIFACKESAQNLTATQKEGTQTIELLADAQSWYNTQMASAPPGKQGKAPDRLFVKPLWNIAKNATADGKTIKAPVSDYALRNIGYAWYHFTRDKDGAVQGWVFEVLYKPSYWWKKADEAKANHGVIKPVKLDFTGVILQYDIFGHFITGRSYRNGKLMTKIVPRESARAQQLAITSATIDPGDDTDDGITGWVIDLPGVDISPDPSEPPPPGWEPSDSTTGFYTPPGEPADYVPGVDVNEGGTITSVITASSTIDDPLEPADVPAPVNDSAKKSPDHNP
ncbi:hypothetical protein [Chitinophaga japonensis]|nr:hypothetical protein [Chitinophaga japonensis]